MSFPAQKKGGVEMRCKPGLKRALQTFDANTAFHEAGHVVSHCHFGHGILRAHVLARGQTKITDHRGRTVKCHGLTEPILHFKEPKLGLSIEQYLGPVEMRQRVREAFSERGTRVIICSYAGPWVEARRRRKSVAAVMLSGGNDDAEEIESILTWLAPGNEVRKQLVLRCLRIVKSFLREPGIWQQVEAVANLLIRDGTVEGDHTLLADITGMRPLPK
jgi:hypothetical protein